MSYCGPSDSRYYGFVPIANVLGQPRLVYSRFEPAMAPGRIRVRRVGHPVDE